MEKIDFIQQSGKLIKNYMSKNNGKYPNRIFITSYEENSLVQLLDFHKLSGNERRNKFEDLMEMQEIKVVWNASKFKVE